MSVFVAAARAALLASLVCMPWLFALLSTRSGHDGARMVQMGLWALAGLAVAAGGGERLLPPRRLPWLAALLVGLLMLVWRAPMPSWAALELALWSGGVAVAMLAARAVREGGRWRAALAWSVLAGATLPLSLDLLVMVVGQFQGIAPRPSLLGAGYDNYRFLNHVQTVSLPLAAVAPVWLGQDRRARALALLALSLGGAVLWATGARASMLALGLTWLAVGLAGGPAGRAVLRRGLCSLPLAALLYAGLWVALPHGLGLPTEGGLAARFDPHAMATEMARWTLWQEAWHTWWHSPWWGIGPMHLAQWPNRYAMHPHQLLLQLLAEWGLWVTGAVLAGAALWLVRRWRDWRAAAAGDAVAAGAFIAVLASLVDAQFSGNYVMPMPQLWIAVAWGMLAGCTPAPAPQPGAWPGWGRALRAALAVGLLLACWTSAAQWSQLEQRLHSADEGQVGSKSQPRFWSHGRLVAP